MKHFVVNPDAFEFDGQVGITDRDIDLVFGPLNAFDEVARIETTDLAVLAVEAGVFPSRGQARKNGLGGSIPHGLHLLGTKKHRFWVWSPVPPTEEPTFSTSLDHTNKWFGVGMLLNLAE